MTSFLAPKQTKYKKQQRGILKGNVQTKLAYGEIGIYTLESFWFSSHQIEAIRKLILKFTKKNGKVFLRVFPDKPVTKRPAESRMGSGKGSVDHWVAPVKSGKILFELKDINLDIAKEAFKQVSYKLPVQTKIYEKNRNNCNYTT